MCLLTVVASSGPPARELGVWVGRSGTGGGQGGVRLCVAVSVAVWQLKFQKRGFLGTAGNRYGDLRSLFGGEVGNAGPPRGGGRLSPLSLPHMGQGCGETCQNVVLCGSMHYVTYVRPRLRPLFRGSKPKCGECSKTPIQTASLGV